MLNWSQLVDQFDNLTSDERPMIHLCEECARAFAAFMEKGTKRRARKVS